MVRNERAFWIILESADFGVEKRASVLLCEEAFSRFHDNTCGEQRHSTKCQIIGATWANVCRIEFLHCVENVGNLRDGR